MKPLEGAWANAGDIGHHSYICGYCGERTGVRIGYYEANREGLICICGGCNRPTFFEARTKQTPAPTLGNAVLHLPPTIEPIYQEARLCTQVQAYTACVLACRKILMHVAVEKKAPENQTFIQYVEYLAKNNYIPPDGKDWVDHIRKKGNEANHEIVIMSQDEAFELLSFVEMLLKFVYEFPARIVPAKASPEV
jgi:hypothetical protein